MNIKDVKIGQILKVKQDANWSSDWKGKRVKVLQIRNYQIKFILIDHMNESYPAGNTCGFFDPVGFELVSSGGKSYYPEWF